MAEERCRVAVIGDRDSVIGCMALGFTVCEVQDGEEAAATLRRLALEEQYAILFLTEGYTQACAAVIDRYKDLPVPAIVTIPSADGAGAGAGMAALHKSVERAVGADILG